MIPINHWKCEICKGYNDILNRHCSFCKSYKPDWVKTEYQLVVEIRRGIYDSYGILASPFIRLQGRSEDKLTMTVNEEKHTKFFNEEMLLVQSMSDADLAEHIHELEDIAREAKARIMAGAQVQRDRAAAKGNKAWRVEPVGPDPTVSDSLNKVKQRSARMGKLDKMREKLSVLGIPESEIDQMLAKMVSQARKEPEALRKEAELKKELGRKDEPSIVTEEERIRRAAVRKELDKQDAIIAKEEKKQKEAGVKVDISTLKFT